MTTKKKISVVHPERLISLKNFLQFCTPTPSRLIDRSQRKVPLTSKAPHLPPPLRVSLSLSLSVSLSVVEMITHDVCAITGCNVLADQLYLLNAPTTEAFKGFIQEITNATR